MPATARKLIERPKPRAKAPAKRLTPEELIKLVRKGREAKSTEEAKRLEDEFVRGFYGK
jgi:hypothetical protein